MFTVEQTIEGAHVRFDTVIDDDGLAGDPQPLGSLPG